MCHDLLDDANLWQLLTLIDHEIAAQVQAQGCACGGVLHSACYPRKPRGVCRALLGEAYESRLSFCCNAEGCRRRCTPPSVRFAGRRVYLGVIVILACALEHGLSAKRRQHLIKHIDQRTLKRWIAWWQEHLPGTNWWQELRGRLACPLSSSSLPGALLGTFHHHKLIDRCQHLMALLMPLSTSSCTHCPRVTIGPQKMHL